MIAYLNEGNEAVVGMVPQEARRILDLGCGGGGTARRLSERCRGVTVVGITHNADEAAIAAPFLHAVHLLDLELELPDELAAALGPPFDVLLFSHVLEHMRDPVAVLRRFLPLLAAGGHVIVAVPNTLEWRTRLAFLRGAFDYAEHGILDRTHLRFFTWRTARRELLDPVGELETLRSTGRGGVPLGPIRRVPGLGDLCRRIDAAAVRHCPNLFAREIVMLARRCGAGDRAGLGNGAGLGKAAGTAAPQCAEGAPA